MTNLEEKIANAEIQETEAVKKYVEQAIQPEQNREKAQSKRRDMKL